MCYPSVPSRRKPEKGFGRRFGLENPPPVSMSTAIEPIRFRMAFSPRPQRPPIPAAPAQHRQCSASKETGCSRTGCETSDPECYARGRARETAADAEHTRDAAPDPQIVLLAMGQARANGQLRRGRTGVQAPEAEKQLLHLSQSAACWTTTLECVST